MSKVREISENVSLLRMSVLRIQLFTLIHILVGVLKIGSGTTVKSPSLMERRQARDKKAPGTCHFSYSKFQIMKQKSIVLFRRTIQPSDGL